VLCDLIPALPALILITAIAQRCSKILSQNPGGCTCTPFHQPAGAHGSSGSSSNSSSSRSGFKGQDSIYQNKPHFCGGGICKMGQKVAVVLRVVTL